MSSAIAADRGESASMSSGALFLSEFGRLLREDHHLAENLRGAADGVQLRPWTQLLTEAVTRCCKTLGWIAAAKGVGGSPARPLHRYEYLGLDVSAFPAGDGWRRLHAAFELENSRRVDKIAYALWKASVVRAELGCLFCYRRDAADVASLVAHLGATVVRPLDPSQELLAVVGTRDTAGTFPDGYFRSFRWNANAVRFESAILEGRR